ncbi:MAG: FAD-dependent thymidylate synthase [Candidatus Eisenbacteria bacterium]|uniref:Flavin-dependent thymidylate synthase n=1 Tax=Eiseniibacteriota bacterium TaxID=2212470 RepID=A0A849SGT9_UNCEI|nr:FAD-dependent thymidylate synthase [Candidatus Eisenbacteria bacterium]
MTSRRPLRTIQEPSVYLVGRQTLDTDAIDEFLADHEVSWKTDTEVGAEALAEMAGRVCYMSYGKGRRTNAEFIGHIVEVGHGSVLEHGVWSFMITGVSRSFTHELIRHRHFSYSQLSQRYVNESDSAFVIPDPIAADPALRAVWSEAVEAARMAYDQLVDGLQARFTDIPDATLRRKLARQAARSVLPNATETKIFMTGNARALRHFIELRGSEHADVEIRKVAVEVLKLMQVEAPNIFADYTLVPLGDGTLATRTEHPKV